VPGYINTQILYYLRGGQITNFAAFQKFKKSCDELLRSLGESGDSPDELITLPCDLITHPQSITTHTNARHSAFSIPEALDSEPDDILPTLLPGGKGLKIDHIITLR
jgi:hypothetical protein